MTSAAQHESAAEPFVLQPTGTHGAALALKQAVAERVAAHRQRRGTRSPAEAVDSLARRDGARPGSGNGAARVRDAVVARYGNAPSYRELLAAEAERALREAQAEAEAAARSLQAAADAQIDLLAELHAWQDADPGPRETAMDAVRDQARGELAHALADIALGARELMQESAAEARLAASRPGTASGPPTGLTELSAGGLTVRLCEDLPTVAPAASVRRAGPDAITAAAGKDELHELEQELAFRRDPSFETASGFKAPLEATAIETLAIPANLIEFPRQLIAPRRARPRLAEGPLRDEAPTDGQLRIFEVAADSIQTTPVPEAAGAPGWQSLLLEAAAPELGALPAETSSQLALPPQVAPMGRRLMATLVDACCLLGALVGFAAVAVHFAGASLHTLPRPLLGVLGGSVLLALFVLYQLLFFTLSQATPGMLYARVALCTFGDDNPSRRAMRRRLLATLLAAAPLGLGLVWSMLDSERLGWHDRMSRMYQRAY